MHTGKSSFGSAKHRTSGTAPTAQHFTGKQGGKRRRRRGLTRKQRRERRGQHQNKYA